MSHHIQADGHPSYDPLLVMEANMQPTGPSRVNAIINGYPEWVIIGRLHDPIEGGKYIVDGHAPSDILNHIDVLENGLARLKGIARDNGLL